MITKESYLSACANGDYTLVKQYLLQPNAVVDCADENGYTAIMNAFDKPEIICLIVEAKPNINLDAQNAGGETALTLAIKDGYNSTVSLLLDLGANPSLPERDGYTPLMIAVIYDSLQSVKKLILAGADLEAVNSENGHTALTLALEEKDLSAARVLIKAKANISNASILKHTFKNDPEIISIIHESEDPSLQLKKALTACFDATNNPNELVDRLLSEIANLSSAKASTINNIDESDALIQTAMDLKDITRKSRSVKRNYNAITPTGLRPQFEMFSRNNSVNNEDITRHHTKKFR